MRRPFQFGLASLLLTMLLFSILAAALGGMIRRHTVGTPMPPGFFILMAVAGPLGVMIGLSLLRTIGRRIGRR